MPRPSRDPKTPLAQLTEMIGIVKAETSGLLGQGTVLKQSPRRRLRVPPRFATSITLTPEDHKKLETLCEFTGLSRSDVIGQLIRSART